MLRRRCLRAIIFIFPDLVNKRKVVVINVINVGISKDICGALL